MPKTLNFDPKQHIIDFDSLILQLKTSNLKRLKQVISLLDDEFYKKEKAKIVQFGDSLIKGGNWDALLGREDVRNSGFPGFTTSHMIWLIKKNVIDIEPEICLIEGGINDISVGIPLKRIESNYISLIDTLLANDITTIVQSALYQENNPHSKVQVDSLNDFLINLCQQKALRYLDINSKLSNDHSLKSEYSIDALGTKVVSDLLYGVKLIDDSDNKKGVKFTNVA